MATFAEFAPRLPMYGVRGPQVTASPYDGSCAACRTPVDLLLEARAGSFCLGCAGFGHLAFLPSGDPSLSRRAREASGQSAVVARANWRRQRYERHGLLVEYRALELACRQCLADPAALADRRKRDERRVMRGGARWEDLAADIRARYPGCPRADVIAYHSALREPGRNSIGRAVTASVTHVDTDYDALVESGVGRADAGERVAHRVGGILDVWRSGVVPLDE